MSNMAKHALRLTEAPSPCFMLRRVWRTRNVATGAVHHD